MKHRKRGRENSNLASYTVEGPFHEPAERPLARQWIDDRAIARRGRLIHAFQQPGLAASARAISANSFELAAAKLSGCEAGHRAVDNHCVVFAHSKQRGARKRKGKVAIKRGESIDASLVDLTTSANAACAQASSSARSPTATAPDGPRTSKPACAPPSIPRAWRAQVRSRPYSKSSLTETRRTPLKPPRQKNQFAGFDRG